MVLIQLYSVTTNILQYISLGMLIIISNFSTILVTFSLLVLGTKGQSPNIADQAKRANLVLSSLPPRSVRYNLVRNNQQSDKNSQKNFDDNSKQNLNSFTTSNPSAAILGSNIPQTSISQVVSQVVSTEQIISQDKQKLFVQKDDVKANTFNNNTRSETNSSSSVVLDFKNSKQLSAPADLKQQSSTPPNNIDNKNYSGLSSQQIARNIVLAFKNKYSGETSPKQPYQLDRLPNLFSQGRKQQSSIILPFSQQFSKFLKHSQIEQIILSADYISLARVIKQTLQSSMDCQERVSYLSDFMGRIHTAIQIKNYTNNQITLNNQRTQDRINKLNQDIKTYWEKMNNLQLASLLDRYLFSAKQLLTFYKIKNNSARQQLQRKNLIIQAQQTKTKLFDKVLQTYQIMTLQKIRLTQTNITSSKQQILQNLKKLNDLLLQYDNQIGQIRKQIINIQNQRMERIGTDADFRTVSLMQLEDNAAKLRDQVNTNIKLYREYNQQILLINYNIVEQRKRISNTEFNKNEQIIKNLIKILPDVKQAINLQNYLCHGIRKLELIVYQNSRYYMMNPEQLVPYIKSSYNISAPVYTFTPIRVQLYAFTIQDKNWKDQFGEVFSQIVLNSTRNLYYNQDFTCLCPQKLQTGMGRITQINKKFIKINFNGVSKKLKFGACTRIQSIYRSIRTCQQMYFRVIKTQEDQYNMYKGTCF